MGEGWVEKWRGGKEEKGSIGEQIRELKLCKAG